MRIFHIRPFIAFILIFLLTGCSSSGKKEEPPVYSPLQVLVPEAPGKKTLGASPLILDISNVDQGYLTAVSDSDSQKMNIQLTDKDGTVYSYFVSPKESAVIPFSSGSGTYQGLLLPADRRFSVCCIICRHSGSQLRKRIPAFSLPESVCELYT